MTHPTDVLYEADNAASISSQRIDKSRFEHTRYLRSSQPRKYSHNPGSALDLNSCPSRVYSIMWIDQNEVTHFDTVIAPCSKLIERTCSNIVRGTLVTTPDGPVAVEDLVPGQLVRTAEYGPLPIRWIGAFEYTSQHNHKTQSLKLYRLMQDSFGLAKPTQDLMLTSDACIKLRHDGCKKIIGADTAFAPISAFEDHANVIPSLPVSNVKLFNIAFDVQATFRANNLEIESYHPGENPEVVRDRETVYALLRMFPHARSLNNFGRMRTKRLTKDQARNIQNYAIR